MCVSACVALEGLSIIAKHQCTVSVMLTAAKSSLTILEKCSGKSMFRNIFEGEMPMITLPTISLKTFFNFQLIVKSVIDIDNDFR